MAGSERETLATASPVGRQRLPGDPVAVGFWVQPDSARSLWKRLGRLILCGVGWSLGYKDTGSRSVGHSGSPVAAPIAVTLHPATRGAASALHGIPMPQRAGCTPPRRDPRCTGNSSKVASASASWPGWGRGASCSSSTTSAVTKSIADPRVRTPARQQCHLRRDVGAGHHPGVNG